MADFDRSITSGRFVLEIDNARVAFLKKFEGLAFEADIVQHDSGPMNMQTKHVANFKYTPGKATIGAAMGKGMYTWIQQSFRKQYATKSGAFIAGDFNYKATHRIDFMNALITEVTMPAFSGDSKEAAYIDVSFETEMVRHTKGGGEDIRSDYGVKQKAWQCSNFRFDLGDLPTKRVAKIDSFTWKQAVVADQIGHLREYTKHPANVKVPDLKVSISSADEGPWADWAKSWFTDGNHLASDHKAGAIVFLGPNMKDEIGRVELKGVGLKKFSHAANEANSEKIKRFDVELYVEEMDFIMNYVDH